MILEYSPRRKDRISPADRGFLYGDGIFETLAVRGGRVCLLEEHFVLLSQNADLLGMTIPYSKIQIARKLHQVIKGSGIRDGIARIIVTRGESSFGLSIENCAKPLIIVWAQSAQRTPQTRGLKVGMSSLVIAPNKIATVKSLNYLVHVMAKREGEEKGFDEMILCGTDGHILSGTSSNLFLVSRGKLLTPAARFIRAGVTRAQVMQLARSQKIRVVEKEFTLRDILSADELFFTSSISGIRAAAQFVLGQTNKKYQSILSGRLAAELAAQNGS